jgi:hypothetical protein
MNDMPIEDYLVIHIGEGKFLVKLENGETKNAGSNLCGMIRYTYFEDYTLPIIGWSVTRKQLYKDYLPKIQKDLLNKKKIK